MSKSSYKSPHLVLNYGSANCSFLLITMNAIIAIGKTIRTDKCIPSYTVNYSLVYLFMPKLPNIGMNSTKKNLINEVKNIASLIELKTFLMAGFFSTNFIRPRDKIPSNSSIGSPM